jgi:cytochrome c oxidase subunit 2
MGPTATVIAIAYAAVVAICVVLYFGLYRSTVRPAGRANTHALAEGENLWLLVAVALLVALLLATIFLVPYGNSAPEEGKRVVNVTGTQFAWRIEPEGGAIEVGEPVEFLAHAPDDDVNHGFAVYEQDGPLVFQIQMQPGKRQRAVHTFTEPGTYEVLCLEFCGVGHHNMTATFEVRERAPA